MRNEKYKCSKKCLKKTEYILNDKDTNKSDGIISDPLGSYTGVAVEKNEKPVQDADDL